MVILGLILVLIALAVGAALVLGTSSPDVASQDVDVTFVDTVTISLTPLTLVIAGMLTMFVLWLGLVLIKTTLTRKARARKLRKQEEAAARERLIEQERYEEDRGYYDDRGYVDEAPRRDTGRTRPAPVDEAPRRPEETMHIPTGEGTDPGATRPVPRDGATGRVRSGEAGSADDATRPIRPDERR